MKNITGNIGRLCEQIRGVSYLGTDASNTPKEGYAPIIRANNITDGKLTMSDLVYVPKERISDKQYLRMGDMIIAASSGSIDIVGKAAVCETDFRGSFGAFCKLLRPDPNKVWPRYFHHFFQTSQYRHRISGLAAGANINNLRNEHINNLQIPLPSLSEQKRIAAILDKADELRRKRREAIAKLDTLIQSIFLDMFGDPVTNPKGWPIVSLGELTTRITKGESPGWQGFEYCNDGPIFITSENVLWGALNFASAKRIPTTFHAKLSRSVLQPQDVLVNLVGASIGRTCLVPDTIGQANVNQAVGVISTGSELHPEFLCALLLSGYGQRTIHGGKVEAARANISLTDLRNFQALLPPFVLQRTFAARVAEVREMEQAQSRSCDKLNVLFVSMQDKAFKGEL